jgi:hypothetical protein
LHNKAAAYIMQYTNDNIEKVAQKIVNDMDIDDLMSYVYDDLVAIMDKEEELFHCNVDHFQMEEE